MMSTHSTFDCAEFPKDAEGRCYHVGVKVGEVANRIITVGDPYRAILLGSFLDQGAPLDPKRYKEFLNFQAPGLMVRTSKRLFTTVTGTYQGVPVSIVAIGMGPPMIDFFIREVRAVVSGPLQIIRFGSCGALNNASAGDIVVALDSINCSRNPDFFKTKRTQPLTFEEFTTLTKQKEGPYLFSLPSSADQELTKALVNSLQSALPSTNQVHQGLDITADSFYSSQGRFDASFKDENQHLFAYIHATYPTVECLQMETFALFHLAETACTSIQTAACAMVFANRKKNTWIDPACVETLERDAGKAVLNALIQVPMDPLLLHPSEGAVWNCVMGSMKTNGSNGTTMTNEASKTNGHA